MSGRQEVTPDERVLHYVRWHAAAYGAPAPQDEIVEKLVKDGMTKLDAETFVLCMDADRKIVWQSCECISGGYLLPEHARAA